MQFDPDIYGKDVGAILALDGGGYRMMPLASGCCSSQEASEKLRRLNASSLFPNAPRREAAMSGLWLYFSCLEESHQVSQGIHSPEGSFWHAIMHRQEPDAGNSAYWFRQTGRHAIFDPLAVEARDLVEAHAGVEFKVGERWDPFAFIDFCESARCKPGGPAEALAMKIQQVEWQLLFDYCARPKQ